MSLPRRHCSSELEARIQELLALQPASTAEPQVAPQADQECHLLRLPAELRKTIYELVVWHDEADGIIAPVPVEEDRRGRPYTTIFATHENWDFDEERCAQLKQLLPQTHTKKQLFQVALQRGFLPRTQRIVLYDGYNQNFDLKLGS